jgi:hypothetical protein
MLKAVSFCMMIGCREKLVCSMAPAMCEDEESWLMKERRNRTLTSGSGNAELNATNR